MHADLADYNVVAQRDATGRLTPTGVIDFGDVVRSWLVADLATAITSLLVRQRRSPLLDACAVVAGFHSLTPLTEPEIAAVWPLVAARASVLATSVDDILAADPGNDYAREEQPLDWLILRPCGVGAVRARRGGAASDGRPGRRPTRQTLSPAGGRTRPVVDLPADAPVIDLSVTTTLLPEATWTDPSATRAALRAALNDGYGVAGTGGCLPFTRRDSAEETPTVHLGCDAFVPVGTAVRAPAAGTVAAAGDGVIVLRTGDVDVTLAGLEPTVAPGDAVDGRRRGRPRHRGAGRGEPAARRTSTCTSPRRAWQRPDWSCRPWPRRGRRCPRSRGRCSELPLRQALSRPPSS